MASSSWIPTPDEKYEESHVFGPPSEPIVISSWFSDDADLDHASIWLQTDEPMEETDTSAWSLLSDEAKATIIEECDVSDLANPALEVIQDPKLMTFLRGYHQPSVDSEGAKNPRRRKVPEPSAKTGKLPRKWLALESTVELEQDPDILELKKELSAIPLKSWTPSPQARFYARKPRIEDQNPLPTIRLNPISPDEPSNSVPNDQTALICFTNYSRTTSYPYSLRRHSQHAILSTQTLGDLYDIIPCHSNDFPTPIYDEDGVTLVGYDSSQAMKSGYVICIDNVVYGDGLDRPDYAGKVKQYVNQKGPGLVKKGENMHEVQLSSIALQLHQPYWLLHQGECEHFIVLDQIRLVHADDPKSGYPLTLQQISISGSLCKICYRMPAQLSVVGDMRIGEPMVFICKTCWEAISESVESEEDDASDHGLVVPLHLD